MNSPRTRHLMCRLFCRQTARRHSSCRQLRRRLSKTTAYLLILTAAAAGYTVSAEEAHITCLDAIESACREDMKLEQIQDQIGILRSRPDPQLLGLLPVLSLRYDGEESFGLFTEYSVQHSISAEVRWDLLAPGKAKVKKEELKYSYAKKLFSYKSRVREIQSEMLELSLQILLAEKKLSLYRRHREKLQMRLDIAKQLNQNRRLTDIELASLDIELASYQLQIEEQKSKVSGLKKAFSSLLNPGTGIEIEPSGTLKFTPEALTSGALPMHADLSFFREEAKKQNPAVRTQILHIWNKRIQQAKQNMAELPEVSIYADYSLSGTILPPPIPSFSLGIHIASRSSLWDIHIQDSLSSSPEQYVRSPHFSIGIEPQSLSNSAASSWRRELHYQHGELERIRRNAALQAERIYHGILIAGKKHEIALKEAELLEKKHRLSQGSYALGGTSLQDLNEAHTALVASRIRILELSAELCLQEMQLLFTCGLDSHFPDLLSVYIEEREKQGTAGGHK